jgi:hypothetical protein
MNQEQISSAFYEAIRQRGISEKLNGISKDVIYHWRKGTRSVTLGDMLHVLWQLNLIKISEA